MTSECLIFRLEISHSISGYFFAFRDFSLHFVFAFLSFAYDRLKRSCRFAFLNFFFHSSLRPRLDPRSHLVLEPVQPVLYLNRFVLFRVSFLFLWIFPSGLSLLVLSFILCLFSEFVVYLASLRLQCPDSRLALASSCCSYLFQKVWI